MSMDWDKLRVFHAVAEAGSFTHAGETLGLSQSAVSRQISALEDSLRVPLFHRHARGLILTEQGEMLQRTAREVFTKLSLTEALILESRDKPRGPLKLTTTYAFGSTWLAPRITQFVQQYPEVQVTLLIDDRELDLGMREADVAIRMLPPRQPDLIQRQLFTLNVHLYASQQYITRAGGKPDHQGDLVKHMLIAFPEEGGLPYNNANWLLELVRGFPLPPGNVVYMNNLYAQFRSVESGLGIAALPDYMVADRPDIVRLLPDMHGPEISAYFVYAEELRSSKRIEVFRDFLIARIAESKGFGGI